MKVYIIGSFYTSDPYEPSDNTVYGTASTKEKALDLIKLAVIKSFDFKIKSIEKEYKRYNEYCVSLKTEPPNHSIEYHIEQYPKNDYGLYERFRCPLLNCVLFNIEEVEKQKQEFINNQNSITTIDQITQSHGYLNGDEFYINELEIDSLPNKYISGTFRKE